MSVNIYQNIHVEGSGRVHLGNEYTSEPKDQRILKWLSPLDPWMKHKEAGDEYREGTLDWFFSDETFLKWLNGDIQVLWCPGPMGTGKTVLMSTILDRLREHDFAGQDTTTAFIYYHCMLEGQKEARIAQAVSKVYDADPKIPPTINQLRNWLKQETESRQRTIIAIDGLDELDQQLREEVLDMIGFSQLPQLQVLVTSRLLPDITLALCNPTLLKIHAPEASVDALITSRLDAASSRRFLRLIEPSNIEHEVRKTIRRTAQGMLMLASLQLDLVLKSRSVIEVRRTLENLPPTLDRYYDMTWQRTNDYEDSRDRTYATTALSLVIHAAQPLSLKELQHGVDAFHLEDSCDIKDALILEDEVLALCAGLLNSSAATDGGLTFSHFSALEYFWSRRDQYFPDAHSLITRACVKYLETWLKGLSDANVVANVVASMMLRQHDHEDWTAGFHPEYLRIYGSKGMGLESHAFLPELQDKWQHLVPENQAEAQVSQKDFGDSLIAAFKFDCSGLGGGGRLVFLHYAYHKIWYHARRATDAQADVMVLMNEHPVLFELGHSGGWIKTLCANWIDKTSGFWYTAQTIHHGLLNHDRFTQCTSFVGSPVRDQHSAYVDGSRPFQKRYQNSRTNPFSGKPQVCFTGVSRRLRIYLLFAAQLYTHADNNGGLEMVRLALLDQETPGHRLYETSKSLIDIVRRGRRDFTQALTDKGVDVDRLITSKGHALWYAYISRNFDFLKLLVESGMNSSGLKHHPILSLPDTTIDLVGTGKHTYHKLSFAAYGPSKSWFENLDYVSSKPECVEGVWQAQIQVPLSDAYGAWMLKGTEVSRKRRKIG